MADTTTLVGALGAAGAAVASAITTVYKTIDVESKLVKMGERIVTVEKQLAELQAAVAEARTFVQSQVNALARARTQPSMSTISTLAERVARMEAWMQSRDEEAEALERRAEHDKMEEVLSALRGLTAKRNGNE